MLGSRCAGAHWFVFRRVRLRGGIADDTERYRTDWQARPVEADLLDVPACLGGDQSGERPPADTPLTGAHAGPCPELGAVGTIHAAGDLRPDLAGRHVLATADDRLVGHQVGEPRHGRIVAIEAIGEPSGAAGA